MKKLNSIKVGANKVIAVILVTVLIMVAAYLFISNNGLNKSASIEHISNRKDNEENINQINLPDNPETKELLLKAEQGDASSQLTIGLMYFSLKEIPINYKQSVKHCGFICETWNSDVFHFWPRNSMRYQEAFKWIKMSADQGNNDAELELGSMFENGFGIKQDNQEALKWYMKSAEKGNISAQLQLGKLHSSHMIGDPLNYFESAKWYRLCAEKGDAICQYSLGLLYYSGNGVPQNFSESLKWYRLSAEHGELSAQKDIGEMYFNGKGVPQNFSESLKWYKKCAENGDIEAQYTVGLMYYRGEGVKKSYLEASRYFLKVAEFFSEKTNIAKATRSTLFTEPHSDMLLTSELTPEFYLGIIYIKGEEVLQNYEESAKWFRKGALAGNKESQFNLGLMYVKGQGVSEDFVQAHKWFNIAAANGKEDTVEYREKIAKHMKPEQIKQAQTLAQRCISSHFEDCN